MDEDSRLRIRNWKKHQHYSYRKPPWIKLYRDILDDHEWHKLSGDTAKGLIMLWLIASEEEGYLPDSKTLAFRLRISENRVIALLSDCSHWLEGRASNPLASCSHDATSEKERETELEEEKESSTKNVEGEFEIFWDAYPRKQGKTEARKSWKKCSNHLGEVLASLASWKTSRQWADQQYIPYPATWINQGLWKEIPHEGAIGNGTRSTRSREDERHERSQEAIENVLGHRSRLADRLREGLSGTDKRGTNAALHRVAEGHKTRDIAQGIPASGASVQVPTNPK